ncbi:PAS domain-containing sensor histidine kinase [Muricauda brasiliensis]|uniref:PAS domain-containing sensor histidine kinase n=1 Tax=Muricauda brasiliensis TaxID=2162892 RepID=UPI000D3C3D78|nr:PAS domain S-box protein [Muricauda brasiliensis]
MESNEVKVLKRALERQKKARAQAEKILEDKSKELYDTAEHLKRANVLLENLLNERTDEVNAAFLNIIDPYVVMDLDFNVIRSNESAKEFLKFNRLKNEVNLSRYVHPDFAQYTAESIQSLLETGILKNYRAKIVLPDNQQKYVQINASLIYDRKANPIAAQGIIRDITQEKDVESLLKNQQEQLKESQDRLATLIKNLEMAVLLEDENRKIALTNKKFCDMFGIQANPEDMIGADCANAAEESKDYFKDPEQFIDRITEILKNQETVLSDELQMTDGRILERDYIPLFNDGVYKGHLWSYRDVTLTKTFRQNLQAEKDKYSGIIANMNLGLIEVDLNGQIQTVNRSFCNISGFEMKELVGSVVHELRTANNKQIIDDKDIAQLKKGQDSHQMAVFNKKGEQRHWLVSSAPRFDEAQRAIGSIGIHLDITEHIKLQLEKEKLLSKLEQSNESLKEYAYVVSHDLKSPLRSIEALASWLSNDYGDSLDDAGKEYLKLIQDKIESMENLISGILAYSTANTSELKNTEIDLHDVVSEIEESIYIPENVKVVAPEKLPTIIADRTKMHQLFQNIISNAVVHIEKENGKVEVLYQDKHGFWEFCIKDNGVGIPKKYHKKIFEIFQSASDDKKSTGIGLSIVKKIIDRYNGEVWVESEEGKGTDFYFTLEKQTLNSNLHEDIASQKVI